MARLAETIVGVFRLQVELPRRSGGTAYVDVVKEYAELTQTLLPTFVSTLDAVLRRQIVAVAERMWSTDPERSVVTVQRTVGFVDLVGYTSATASLSLRELTDVLIDFDLRTSEIVAGHKGQIIKTIGDEAMFVTEAAEDACQIALDLIDASGGTLPPVRVGLATGEMALGVRRPLRARRQPGRPARRRGRALDGRRVRERSSGTERRLPVRAPPTPDAQGLRGADHGVPAGAWTTMTGRTNRGSRAAPGGLDPVAGGRARPGQ